LPKILDAGRIATDEEGPKIVVHEGRDGHMAVGESSAAQAVKPRLGCLYLHYDKIDARRGSADGSQVADCGRHNY